MRRNNHSSARQSPKRRVQISVRRHRPFYKRGWFWTIIGTGLFLMLFLMMTALKQSNVTQSTTTQATALLTIPHQRVHTDRNGEATIQGTSPAGTVLTYSGGHPLTVSKTGRFTIKYRLKSPQRAVVEITAKSIANTTANARVTVLPSTDYLAASKQQTEASQSSKSTAPSAAEANAQAETKSDTPAPSEPTPQPKAKADDNPLNAKQTLNWQVANTEIMNVETAVADGQLTLTVNWKNIDNQDMPMFISLFNEPTVAQGAPLEPIQNNDSSTALLPQFQNSVGASMALKYLYKLNDDTSALAITLTTKDGQTKTVTIGAVQ